MEPDSERHINLTPLSECHVIQFLRGKVVERDRTIFELQKKLQECTEALHNSRKETIKRSTTKWEPCDGAWKQSSKLIVKCLLERIAMMSEHFCTLEDLKISCLHRCPIAPAAQCEDKRHQSLDSLRALENEKAILQRDLMKCERLVVSTTVECKRLQNDVQEERLRNEILQHRVDQLSRQSSSAVVLAGEAESLRTALRTAQDENRKLLDKIEFLKREQANASSSWQQRYSDLLVMKDGLAEELKRVRLDLLLASDTDVKTPSPQQEMMRTGPIRLDRLQAEPRNPYSSGMFLK